MICGMDVLLQEHAGSLKKRRVALLSHQAALVRGGATSAQALRRAVGPALCALFGPEHGFTGQTAAGEKTFSSNHPEWGIPVYSLYGEMRSPSAEMLAGIDTVICDLQDIGVRCYTYLATLLNMCAVCREAGINLIVTDRPVPLPVTVDGPLTEPGSESFVAPCPLPMVYGMTPGETVRWLCAIKRTTLQPTVVPMSGWRRADSLCFSADTGGFMAPSPALNSIESTFSYAALVFCEALSGIDCGRGTNMSFRLFGAPWLEGEAFSEILNRRKISGVHFHPHRYVAASGRWQGRELNGVRLGVHKPAAFHPVECSLHIIRELVGRYGDSRVWRAKGVRQHWFDKLYGGSTTRHDLKNNVSVGRIAARWRRERTEFMRAREKAMLYRG